MIDQLQRRGREVQSDESGVRDEGETEEEDQGGEQAEEIQEPHPQLLHQEGHQEYDCQSDREDYERKGVVQRVIFDVYIVLSSQISQVGLGRVGRQV